jgi:hypothetical protein
VLNEGELRGIGVVADVTSRVSGKTEVVWQGAAGLEAVRQLAAECHATGETVRAVFQEKDLDGALEALRRTGARLISVNPVRSTLEDYFIERLAAPALEAHR